MTTLPALIFIYLPRDFESFSRKIHHPCGDPNRSPNIKGVFILPFWSDSFFTWHLEPLMDFKPPISMGSPKGVPVPWHSMCTSKQERWHDGICGEMPSWLQWKYPKNIRTEAHGTCINSLLCKATDLTQNDRVSLVLLITHDSNSGSAFFFSLKACLLRKVSEKNQESCHGTTSSGCSFASANATRITVACEGPLGAVNVELRPSWHWRAWFIVNA